MMHRALMVPTAILRVIVLAIAASTFKPRSSADGPSLLGPSSPFALPSGHKSSFS